MANQHFHITISGDNYLFSKQISFEDLKKINYLLLENPPSQNFQTSQAPNDVQTHLKESNLNESDLALTLKNSQARRTPDKIVVFAQYLRNQFDQTTFDKSDLINCFEQAQESVPKNLNRDLLWTKKIGWIAEKINIPGSFYLTQEGQNAIESKFPKNIIKKTTIATKL